LLRLRGEIALLKAIRSGGRPEAAASPSNPRPEDPGAKDLAASVELGRQLGEAIVRGDPQALGKLLTEAREEQARFKTNSTGLNDQQRADLARLTFAPLHAAFGVITRGAVQGQPNAINAINDMIAVSEFRGLVIQSLGTLAGKGNNDALEVLLDPARFGFPSTSWSSVVGALVPAAENGDERAINALIAVTQDTDHRALWFMAATGLNTAAATGNPAAIDALINLAQIGSTNKSVLNAAMSGLQKAAANQNQKAADALASLRAR